MQTIVTGYDGSDEAKDALRLASGMSKSTGAQLVVACVDEIEPYWGDLNLEQLNEERAHYFARMFGEVAEQIGEDFERVTGAGSAPPALERIAELRHAEAIVVGSTHRAGIGKVLPGSTASRLLAGSSCSIVVAPKGYAKEPEGSLQHIGVAYDGQHESDLALDAAIELASGVGGDLKLIAVNQDPAQISRGYGGAIAPEAFADVLDGYFRERLDAGLKRIPAGIASSSVIRAGHPDEELAKEGAKLDLLVIGSRGYGPVRRVLLGGTAHKLVAAATCPVMVVARGAEKSSKAVETHEAASVA
jgi:nucleotide-binding universal stress UspA family protein